MNPLDVLYAHNFAKEVADTFSPKARRNAMRRNPLWPTPTPTVYRTGRLNNPLFPAVTPVMGRTGRLGSTPPIRNPRRRKGKWIQKAKVKKGALRDQLKRLGKLKGDGAIPIKVLKWAAKKGGVLAKRANLALTLRGIKHKRKSASKRKNPYYSRSRYSKRSPSRRYSGSGSLVKIYNKTDRIFASGSVNAGHGYGVKASDKFTHKFTTKPAIYGVPKSGRYSLPAGAIVIKGHKKLFKQFGSKELSFRSSRKLRSRSRYSRRSLR